MGYDSANKGQPTSRGDAVTKEPVWAWTFPVGRFAGIPLRMHFLFPVAVAALILFQTNGVTADLTIAVVVTSLSILAHEMGHAIASKHFGRHVHGIVLLPLRAVPVVEPQKLTPHQDIRIALSGPTANAMAVIVSLGVISCSQWAPFKATFLASAHVHDVLVRICFINSFLSLINFVPALPFDGGRALLLFLIARIGMTRSLRIIIQISLAIAIGIGVAAVVTHLLILSLLALFIALGATREAQASRNQIVDLSKEPALALILDDARTLTSGESVVHAAATVEGSTQNVFPVIQGQELVGMISRFALVRSLARKGDLPYVAGVMNRNFQSLQASAPAQEAISLLSRSPLGAIAVFEGDEFMGIVTSPSANKFLTRMATEQSDKAGQEMELDARTGGDHT